MSVTASKLSWTQFKAMIEAMPDGPDRDKAVHLALQVYGEAPQTARFLPYRFKPALYLKNILGWEAWRGQGHDLPGQQEILDAYTLSLLQQFEKRDFEAGILNRIDLRHYEPGQIIKNYIRMEAGHNTGKTKIASGIVSHFFDCFAPSSIQLYAPTWDSLKYNFWQEIKGDRKGKKLTGRILETVEIYAAEKHFIKGRAVSNAKDLGTERVQGMHAPFQLFALDEAEGVESVVYDAIPGMISGGISIVLLMANPKTRTSRFHRIKEEANVESFRMSCINHPNVVAGKEVVPNAVQREYVRSMIEAHCEVAKEHDVDRYTFSLDFDIPTKHTVFPAGTIFQPDNEFMWRVLGVAPAEVSDMTVIPYGRYEAAVKRKVAEYDPEDEERATFGIDVARSGIDYGTLYVKWKNTIWRAKQFYHQDSKQYFHFVLTMAKSLAAKGVRKLHIRVDAGGGGGLIDTCRHSVELRELFLSHEVQGELAIFEVHFGGNAHDGKIYDDLVTEMYFETAESLFTLRILSPPAPLEDDLTLRKWEPVNRRGKELKKLVSKPVFKKLIKRSPDDGDGFVLAAAPDFCFKSLPKAGPESIPKASMWTV